MMDPRNDCTSQACEEAWKDGLQEVWEDGRNSSTPSTTTTTVCAGFRKVVVSWSDGVRGGARMEWVLLASSAHHILAVAFPNFFLLPDSNMRAMPTPVRYCWSHTHR